MTSRRADDVDRFCGRTGAGSRLRRLRALRGSLPRHDEIAWVRRAYSLGWGDAM